MSATGAQPHDNRQAAEDADVVSSASSRTDPRRAGGDTEAVEGMTSAPCSSPWRGGAGGAMEDAVVAGHPVVRVMPNTPMLVGRGMNAIATGRFVNPGALAEVTELLSSVVEVPSSRKPTWTPSPRSRVPRPPIFPRREALIDAGVSLGLSRPVAEKLVTTSAAAPASCSRNPARNPATLRANVSSPAGTTVGALRELEESGCAARSSCDGGLREAVRGGATPDERGETRKLRHLSRKSPQFTLSLSKHVRVRFAGGEACSAPPAKG